MAVVDAFGRPVATADLAMTREEVALFIQLDRAIRRLQLHFVCPKCRQFAQAGNAPADAEYCITCGCTTRRWRRPTAAPTPVA